MCMTQTEKNLSPTDLLLVAAEATVSLSTVKRVLEGLGNPNSRKRVADACRQLGIELPVRG
jgi:DNA-binding LacI/PurR family transcriptional regulator